MDKEDIELDKFSTIGAHGKIIEAYSGNIGILGLARVARVMTQIREGEDHRMVIVHMGHLTLNLKREFAYLP